jgi:hypothetical protein
MEDIYKKVHEGIRSNPDRVSKPKGKKVSHEVVETLFTN